MKTIITNEYTSKLFSRFRILESEIGPIPKVFRSEDINNTPRPEGTGFDVNRYLDIFDKIKLKKGIILDYAYHWSFFHGSPCIYTRRIDEPAISVNEYHKKYHNIEQPYLNDIIIENNAKSFFQLAVFTKVIHQFYLWWHANYNDHHFVVTINFAEEILKSIKRKKGLYGISIENRDKLKQLDFNSQVECFEDCGRVHYIMFSNWIGFYQETATIYWPKLRIEIKKKTIVSYDCGICY